MENRSSSEEIFGGVMPSLRRIIESSANRHKTEAETRHKVIDFIIHDVLSWPKNRVSVEEFVHPGYADYILRKSNGESLLFIEAKREGVYFALPIPHKDNEKFCYIGIQKLLSDDNIKAAMTQVRTYCIDSGCEFACVTNGTEWIFFKTFDKGKRWETLQAFVVRDLSFFESEYTRAVNCLSFMAVTENSSLVTLLTSSPPKDRNLYFPKERIPGYAHTIAANRLAANLRPIVNYYFGVIEDNDTEFMDRCYVSQRDYKTTHASMRSMLQDSLTPYFESYGVQQLDETGKGGRLGGRLTKNIRKDRKGEVLILFGGKGSGKSTFIKRLLHHNPPPWLKDHSVVALIDLLRTPENSKVIRQKIWDDLVTSLDLDGVLSQDRAILVGGLFRDRFNIVARQELFGLAKSSEAYNVKLNTLLEEWKKDKKYCARRIVEYWRGRGRGVVVVVDNTDQYSGEVQEFCFSSAQEISAELDCITLISMREERFHNSKIHGVLDAFQNAGFHISSPKPSDVFRRRLDYTVSLLNDKNRRQSIFGAIDESIVLDISSYLEILNREFSNEQSPLNSFLTACAHGDIRLSLDLFRSFALSGYTNVDEMLSVGRWNFQIHQVIKPVMIPNRYFYDEKLSDIPNVYQIRHNRHGSHFTSLRILRKLSKNTETSSAAYLSMSMLKSYFVETFNMLDDFSKNVDMLLKHGFVESNNRLDTYSDDVDSIKITNYGIYMLNEMSTYFTYLDLISIDCGVFNETIANYVSESGRREYSLFMTGERQRRVEVRVQRVEEFLGYLDAEENREREFYSLGMPMSEMFTHKLNEVFLVEKPKVLGSAQKTARKKLGTNRGRSKSANDDANPT